MPRSDVTVQYEDIYKGRSAGGKVWAGAVVGTVNAWAGSHYAPQSWTVIDNRDQRDWNTSNETRGRAIAKRRPDPGFQTAIREVLATVDSGAAEAKIFKVENRKLLEIALTPDR